MATLSRSDTRLALSDGRMARKILRSPRLSGERRRQWEERLRGCAYRLFVDEHPDAARYLRWYAMQSPLSSWTLLALIASLGVKRSTLHRFRAMVRR
jgi:hypothetical protein